MENKTFEEVAQMWQEEKRHYVKRSTYVAYALLLANHLVPAFGPVRDVTESMVQDFVLKKLDHGLSQKSVKDMLVVMRMVLRTQDRGDMCPAVGRHRPAGRCDQDIQDDPAHIHKERNRLPDRGDNRQRQDHELAAVVRCTKVPAGRHTMTPASLPGGTP